MQTSIGEGELQSESVADLGWLHRAAGRVATARSLVDAVAMLLESLREEQWVQSGCLWQRDDAVSEWRIAFRHPHSEAVRQPGELVAKAARTQEAQWCEMNAPLDARRDWGEPPAVYCVAFPVLVDQAVEGVVELSLGRAAAELAALREVLPLLALQLGYVRKLEQLECQLAMSAERERERLGEAMHDGLGQQIAGLAMLAEVACRRASGPLAEQLQTISQAASEAKQQVRWLTRGLLPQHVEPSDLGQALHELAEQTQACHSVACVVECGGRFAAEDATVATHLYLIAKEGVHNAVKHARATQIVLALDGEDGGRLEVRDDGRGCEGEEGGRCDGNGLRIMRRRAASIGWEFHVLAGEGGGTVVRCSKKTND